MINDIESSSPDASFCEAKMTVQSEEIKHHVHEEEMPSESMFAQCRQTDVDLVALRDQLAARKAELLDREKKGVLPSAKPTAVALQSP